jgi:hypothetical protein
VLPPLQPAPRTSAAASRPPIKVDVFIGAG